MLQWLLEIWLWCAYCVVVKIGTIQFVHIVFRKIYILIASKFYKDNSFFYFEIIKRKR